MTEDTIIQSWFNASVQPSKTLLWVSAVAPDTFQGNPRLLQELLKRPLESPDAMGRKRASVRYGACLIAHAINLLNPEPAVFISLLHEFNFFRQPDTILQKSITEELNTKILQLVDQSFDPTPIWQKQHPRLTQFFQESMKKVQTLFGRCRGKVSSPDIASFFSFEQEWWGVTHHYPEKILNIFPPFLFLPYLARYLLLREAVRLILPSSFRNSYEVQEFANVVVEELLDESQRQLWVQIKRGGQELTQDLHQRVSGVSMLTPQLIKQKRLPQLFGRLNDIDKIVSEAPSDAFTKIAQQELSEIPKSVTLTKPQHKILLAIARNPIVSERQLAKDTKLARNTISRNLLGLQRQLGIHVHGEINYLKVGLQPLLLTVTSTHSDELKALAELSQQLRTFPYCTRLSAPISFTGTTLYALLTLPNTAIPDFQQYLGTWTANRGSTTKLAKISLYEWGWYLPYWTQIPLDEWRILARSALREMDPTQGLNTQLVYQGTSMRITREALRVILTLQENMRISQRQLAKEAQTAVTTAANYYNRFFSQVITPSVEITKSPLQEIMIFTINRMGGQLDTSILNSLRLFPAYQIWHLSSIEENSRTDKPGLLVSAGFPSGNLVPVNRVLNEIINQFNAVASIPLISNAFLPRVHGLPIALFKTVGQEWICPSTLMEPLFTG